MDFIKLAVTIRRFGDINLLADEIETLEYGADIKTIDDLTDFLEYVLDYSEY